ncbi:MAG: 50S ribosome-binding GTPase [Candidatus Omnitrophica bacterium]|nr:50S ribosome-binding GTPase [Candidatus Omnitrophota bacterium]
MIIDQAKIYCKGGNGGEGDCSKLTLSARRVIGGGGDGGGGGDVIIKVSPHLYDLNKFLINKKFIAACGERGKRNNRKGARGENLIVNVPQGTRILDLEGNLIVDLAQMAQEFLICRGGEGGRGNYKKEYSLPAQAGEERDCYLDYRIPNDVAILGFANNGKTSLLNKLTSKNFKVADYPFTTKACAWAQFESAYRKFVIMDMPPLKKNVKDAYAENNFIKHLYRSKIILFVSDNFSAFKEEFSSLKEQVSSLDEELLAGKKILYVLNKVDTIDKNTSDLKNIIPVSALNGAGIEELKEKIIKTLQAASHRSQA